MKGCTIYFILQRPLTYFNNLRLGKGMLYFAIEDGTQPPLACSLNLVASGISKAGEADNLKALFYKSEPDKTQPFNDVAGFQIFRPDGKFVVWYSPQKFLYECLVGNLSGTFHGDVSLFTDFTVHYIGKAFSRRIWERLTGHEKMQKILTLEGPLSRKEKLARAPFEISLLMLDIIGFDDVNFAFNWRPFVSDAPEPIVHKCGFEVNDAGFSAFNRPLLKLGAPELTTEVEAFLVDRFQPQYNQVKFETYPYIRKGTRSAGYTDMDLQIEKFPVTLKTKSHIEPIVLGRR